MKRHNMNVNEVIANRALEILGYEKGDFPVSESHSRRVFSLPMHPYLKPEEQERISASIG